MKPRQPKADVTPSPSVWTCREPWLQRLPSRCLDYRASWELREIEATALARLRLHAIHDSRAVAKPEQLLDVTVAAKRLSVSKNYLYWNWKKLPFARSPTLPFM